MAFEKSLEGGSVEAKPPESRLGSLLWEEKSENFPGAKIVAFESDGKVTRYAVSRNAQGELQGNSFELQEYTMVSGVDDGYWKNSPSSVNATGQLTVNGKDIPKFRVGPTYQMREAELAEVERMLEMKGIKI